MHLFIVNVLVPYINKVVGYCRQIDWPGALCNLFGSFENAISVLYFLGDVPAYAAQFFPGLFIAFLAPIF